MSLYPKCECLFSDFCERHIKKKSVHEYRRCQSSDFYRRQQDVYTYGFGLDHAFSETDGLGQLAKNIRSNLTRVYELESEFDKDYVISESDLSNTKLYVIGHRQSKLDSIPNLPYTEKFNLETAHYGKYEKYALAYPDLCENRFYFADIDYPEMVGTVTASWKDKFILPEAQIENFPEWKQAKILFSNKDRNIVLCAFYSKLQKYENENKYFEDFLYDIGLQDLKNVGAWANQIICKREIFQELKEFMVEAMIKLIELNNKCDLFANQKHCKYNLTRYNGRGLGLLAEEISARWFCSRSQDTILDVQQTDSSWYY